MHRNRRGSTAERHHGTLVPDPYRWLEEDGDPETRAWSEWQRSMFEEHIRGIPARPRIRERLRELWNYPRQSAPIERDGRYFYSASDGLRDQPVVYVRTSRDAEPEPLLDPNVLGEDGTTAITEYVPNRDGTRVAYKTASGGSDWQEIRIRDVDTREDYDEVLRHCKYAGIAWTREGDGFFYDRYPEPGTVPPGAEHAHNRLYWHTLGTPQEEDRLVYEEPELPERAFRPSITEDGKYLLLSVAEGTRTENRIYYREVEGDGPFVKLLNDADAGFHPAGNAGPVFYFRTNLNAPRGRIVAIDVNDPGRKSWRGVVDEGTDVLTLAGIFGSHLVVCAMRDVHARLGVYTLGGELVREIPLPAHGSITELNGTQNGPEMFFSFTSFLQPEMVFRHDLASGDLDVVHAPDANFDADHYETTQVFYPSKDGTEVPMFVTHRKGLQRDGTHPALLYGYGGFTIPVTPSFSPSTLVWLESGGVYAVANIRGGGELGEEWHEAGMFGRKQNVFDDFIAAGEWLVENGYTRRERLAIEGASNGGLLVAACLLQRPDLWGAVVCNVPVTDMLRFHLWTGGRYWNGEFGNAADPEHFEILHAYSPLHNVGPAAYPPVLITTADSDDRVVPAHARKFTAALQEAQTADAPVLLRTETRAGHGQGKPTSKLIEEATDACAFLADAFDMEGCPCSSAT